VIHAGILDLLQNFSPGRHPAVLDWLSSSAGGPDRDHAHACGDEVWRRWRPRICDGSRPPTWHPVQAACPTLGASDPRILIHCDHLPAMPLRHRLQLTPLVLCGLSVRADPQIDGSSIGLRDLG
jgi:hypothetical protein